MGATFEVTKLLLQSFFVVSVSLHFHRICGDHKICICTLFHGNFNQYKLGLASVIKNPGDHYQLYLLGVLLQARLRTVQSPETLDAFIELMHFLSADGFSRVHIMAHSIGARVLTGAASRLEKVVQGVGPEQSGRLPLKIASITLLSPDCDLEPFRRTLGHKFRALCPLVTIYGDRTDQALSYAEMANWAIDFFISRSRKREGLNSSSSHGSKISSEAEIERTLTESIEPPLLGVQDNSTRLGSRIEKVRCGNHSEQSVLRGGVAGEKGGIKALSVRKLKGHNTSIFNWLSISHSSSVVY